tara:strand:- start:461 stop:613 length:153 start_codon:yes stop_codon:yes gene_type:complete
MEQGVTIFGFQNGLAIDLTQVATSVLIALVMFCVKKGLAAIKETSKKALM